MGIKVKDRVRVYNLKGEFHCNGIVTNVNSFREPSQEYAVDLETDTTDLVFVSREQLERI